VREGDAVVAMASSGFHSNGYSLVRRVVSAAGLDLAAVPEGLARPLGEELLEPTRIYARDCLALVEQLGVDGVHAFAHITGGGLAGNTARVVPDGLEAVLDRGTWALPRAVRLLEEHGVPRTESERAFNCGVGMVAAVAPEDADRAVELLSGRGVPAWVAGTVGRRTDDGGPAARLVSAYR
jgi:phosphoribosylformylglycinamidine cyclo-ligase